MTDIVICTHNRLAILQRTLSYIMERTLSPYRLHVVDDGSTEGNAEYLLELWRAGKLAGLYLRQESHPHAIGANWNLAPWLGQSENLIFSDDDILCPRLEPDWLALLQRTMRRHRKLGVLALHCPSRPPQIKDIGYSRSHEVTICDRVGMTLTCIRRALMRRIVVPETGKLAGIPIKPHGASLTTAWGRAIRALGYQVAYLSDVYCQHIGIISIRNARDLSNRMVEPIDKETLMPPEGWRG